ncbi:MAG: hypothetical protein L0Y42_08150 [Phycisphaerales bacterium]|nr:hypothetical protein [Phycisphaerales bacterium]
MSIAQILLAVLTIAMSGVVAAVVTSILNTRREERQFRRKRLEELYRAFTGFCTQLDVHWLHHTSVMTGKIDHNQALDLTIAAGEGEERHFENVEMLAAIYWPEFNPFVDELKQLRSQANDILHAHKQRYLAGHREDKESFDAIRRVGESLDNLRDRFRDKVREIAKHLR